MVEEVGGTRGIYLTNIHNAVRKEKSPCHHRHHHIERQRQWMIKTIGDPLPKNIVLDLIPHLPLSQLGNFVIHLLP